MEGVMFDVSPTAGFIVASGAHNDPERLFLEVCSANGMRPSVVRSPRRDRAVVNVRRQAARVLRDAGCSYPEIGRLLGGRHHATIMQLLNPDMGRRKYLPRKLAGMAREESR